MLFRLNFFSGFQMCSAICTVRSVYCKNLGGYGFFFVLLYWLSKTLVWSKLHIWNLDNISYLLSNLLLSVKGTKRAIWEKHGTQSSTKALLFIKTEKSWKIPKNPLGMGFWNVILNPGNCPLPRCDFCMIMCNSLPETLY